MSSGAYQNNQASDVQLFTIHLLLPDTPCVGRLSGLVPGGCGYDAQEGGSQRKARQRVTNDMLNELVKMREK